MPLISQALKRACVAGLLLLAGCGFQLRGSTHLPFDSFYVPVNSSVGVELKRNIAASSTTRLVNEAKDAQAQLIFTADQREKVILSLNTAGRVQEFQLRYRVGFRVIDNRGLEYLPLNEITLTRDISFNDSQVLAKETEEQLLYRDMQTDMVQQILRRLAFARAPSVAIPPPGLVTPGREGTPVPATPIAPSARPGGSTATPASPGPQAPTVPNAPAASTASPN